MSDAPPQNLEAELSLLGAMMVGKSAVSAAAEIVKAQDFYRESNGKIFDCILSMDERGDEIDALTVAAELERQGILADIGGKLRIHEIASHAGATSNAARYAEIVKEHAVRRSLIRAGYAITEIGQSGVGEPAVLIGDAEAQMSQVDAGFDSADSFRILGGGDGITQTILSFAAEGKERTGLKTRFPTLDRLSTGLHGAELIVLAANTGVGKSALAQNIAQNVIAQEKGVLLFTLEMSREQIMIRELSRHCDIDPMDLITAKLDVHQQAKVKAEALKIAKMPLYVEDNSALRMPELRAKARRACREHPEVGLMIVDYLQLMVASEDKASREQEVASISRGLKLLAKELNIPVLALAQLNRNNVGRPDKRPILADLRDSGAIEQDADMVWMLYRESMHTLVEDPAKVNDTELLIRKNRMTGVLDTVNLTFVKRKQLYREPAKGNE